MSMMRRRRLAWLCTLVLIMELALLCCAYNHNSHHLCADSQSCAICAWMRSALLRFFLPPAATLSILTTLRAAARVARESASTHCITSLYALRVRLND